MKKNRHLVQNDNNINVRNDVAQHLPKTLIGVQTVGRGGDVFERVRFGFILVRVNRVFTGFDSCAHTESSFKRV